MSLFGADPSAAVGIKAEVSVDLSQLRAGLAEMPSLAAQAAADTNAALQGVSPGGMLGAMPYAGPQMFGDGFSMGSGNLNPAYQPNWGMVPYAGYQSGPGVYGGSGSGPIPYASYGMADDAQMAFNYGMPMLGGPAAQRMLPGGGGRAAHPADDIFEGEWTDTTPRQLPPPYSPGEEYQNQFNSDSAAMAQFSNEQGYAAGGIGLDMGEASAGGDASSDLIANIGSGKFLGGGYIARFAMRLAAVEGYKRLGSELIHDFSTAPGETMSGDPRKLAEATLRWDAESDESIPDAMGWSGKAKGDADLHQVLEQYDRQTKEVEDSRRYHDTYRDGVQNPNGEGLITRQQAQQNEENKRKADEDAAERIRKYEDEERQILDITQRYADQRLSIERTVANQALELRIQNERANGAPAWQGNVERAQANSSNDQADFVARMAETQQALNQAESIQNDHRLQGIDDPNDDKAVNSLQGDLSSLQNSMFQSRDNSAAGIAGLASAGQAADTARQEATEQRNINASDTERSRMVGAATSAQLSTVQSLGSMVRGGRQVAQYEAARQGVIERQDHMVNPLLSAVHTFMSHDISHPTQAAHDLSTAVGDLFHNLGPAHAAAGGLSGALNIFGHELGTAAHDLFNPAAAGSAAHDASQTYGAAKTLNSAIATQNQAALAPFLTASGSQFSAATRAQAQQDIGTIQHGGQLHAGDSGGLSDAIKMLTAVADKMLHIRLVGVIE